EELRDCEIAVKYSYNSGSSSVSKTVAVVQDHPGSGSNGGGGGDYDGDISSLVGTYTASGYSYYSSGTVAAATWTLKIFEYTYSGYTYALIDGLTPAVSGSYLGEGDWAADGGTATNAYIALGYLENGALVIPTQLTGYYNSSGQIGWTPCVEFDDGWYYSSSWPDCTFSYNETAGTWTSDYGEFLGLFEVDSNYNITSFSGFMDVTNPGVVLTKTADTTSTSAAPSAYIDSLAEQIISGSASGMVFHPINEGLKIHTDFFAR
ncbi:MAG: hypothetical protein LUE27_10020, partial [Clostridia bacterium]|nr:hypothetical protein [Clostridia bacterium]